MSSQVLERAEMRRRQLLDHLRNGRIDFRVKDIKMSGNAGETKIDGLYNSIWFQVPHLAHSNHSEMIRSLDGVDELVVELVGAQRVGQLAEIHFEQRGNGVHILSDGLVLHQSRHPVLVKSISKWIRKRK